MHIRDIGKKIGAGRTAVIYEYGQDKIVKLFKVGFPSAAVQQEYQIGKLVSSMAVPAPQVGSLVKLDGQEGIVYQKISGFTLLEQLIRSFEKAATYIEKFVQLHVKIHSLQSSCLPDGRQKLVDKIASQKLLQDSIKEQLQAGLSDFPAVNSLCHGDYHPDNIILHNGQLIVIDWVDAYYGYPLLDVARTYLLISTPYVQVHVDTGTISEMQKVLAGKYLEEYYSLRPFSREDFNRALKIVAAARLAENVPNEQEWLLSIIHDRSPSPISVFSIKG